MQPRQKEYPEGVLDTGVIQSAHGRNGEKIASQGRQASFACAKRSTPRQGRGMSSSLRIVRREPMTSHAGRLRQANGSVKAASQARSRRRIGVQCRATNVSHKSTMNRAMPLNSDRRRRARVDWLWPAGSLWLSWRWRSYAFISISSQRPRCQATRGRPSYWRLGGRPRPIKPQCRRGRRWPCWPSRPWRRPRRKGDNLWSRLERVW